MLSKVNHNVRNHILVDCGTKAPHIRDTESEDGAELPQTIEEFPMSRGDSARAAAAGRQQLAGGWCGASGQEAEAWGQRGAFSWVWSSVRAGRAGGDCCEAQATATQTPAEEVVDDGAGEAAGG